MKSKFLHIPVLLNEVLEALSVSQGEKYIDCTLGAGGHSEAILSKGGKVLGIEADESMLSISKERLKNYCPTLLQGNFSDVYKIAKQNGFLGASGILFDLGISSYHYETLKRGFSINKGDDILDMRLEPTKATLKASDLLNILPLEKLIEMFSHVLPQGEARQVSKIILNKRAERPFEYVSDVTSILHKSLPEVFLALRMAVNDEFHSIENGILGAYDALRSGGVMVIISFHSGEDKLVLHLIKQLESEGKGCLITKKPITPSTYELEFNPRSRSALMRIFKKI